MRRSLSTGLTAALFSAALATAALAAPPIKTSDTNKGPALTDTQGMTLYTFDKDSDGKSACNGNCTKNWPPLMAAAGDTSTGQYGVITREDGAHQWTYKGKPLYTWSKDTKAGETSGDGFGNGVWHVAQP